MLTKPLRWPAITGAVILAVLAGLGLQHLAQTAIDYTRSTAPTPAPPATVVATAPAPEPTSEPTADLFLTADQMDESARAGDGVILTSDEFGCYRLTAYLVGGAKMVAAVASCDYETTIDNAITAATEAMLTMNYYVRGTNWVLLFEDLRTAELFADGIGRGAQARPL